MPLPAHLHAIALAIKRRIVRAWGRNDDPYPAPPDDIRLSPSEKHIHDYAGAPLTFSWRNWRGDDALELQELARAKLAELSGSGAPESSPEASHELPHGLPRESHLHKLISPHWRSAGHSRPFDLRLGSL